MGKITFRADDALVDELEALDASKSEVMREALRSYLDAHARSPSRAERSHRSTGSDRRGSDADELIGELVDELVRERVDELLTRRADDRLAHDSREVPDVNVTIALEGDNSRKTSVEHVTERPERSPEPAAGGTDRGCDQCGEELDSSHVYCPNCGEKATRRLFCECGDEIRSDWAFCPSCGRRTPAADVLDPETL